MSTSEDATVVAWADSGMFRVSVQNSSGTTTWEATTTCPDVVAGPEVQVSADGSTMLISTPASTAACLAGHSALSAGNRLWESHWGGSSWSPLAPAATDSNGDPIVASSGRLSGDGAYVAFATAAQLVSEDTDALDDVYIQDRVSGEVTLISDPRFGSHGFAFPSDVSADGRYVLWTPQHSYETMQMLPEDAAGVAVNALVTDRDADGDGTFDEVGDVRARFVPFPNTNTVEANRHIVPLALVERSGNLAVAYHLGSGPLYITDLDTGEVIHSGVTLSGSLIEASTGGRYVLQCTTGSYVPTLTVTDLGASAASQTAMAATATTSLLSGYGYCHRLAGAPDALYLQGIGSSFQTLEVGVTSWTTSSTSPAVVRTHAPGTGAPAVPATFSRDALQALDASMDGSTAAAAAQGSSKVRVRKVSGTTVHTSSFGGSTGCPATTHAVQVAVAPDGEALAFTTASPAYACEAGATVPTGETRIWLSTWNGSSWEAPQLLTRTPANVPSDGNKPIFSADGKWIVFVSNGQLIPGDTDSVGDLYAYDILGESLTRIEESGTGWDPQYGAWPHAISDDGRYVVWSNARSYQSNLVRSDDAQGSASNVLLTDRDTDVDGVLDESGTSSVSLIGYPTANTPEAARQVEPLAVTNSGVVLYRNYSTNFLYAYEQASQAVKLVSSLPLGTAVDVSSDGRFIAECANTWPYANIRLRDLSSTPGVSTPTEGTFTNLMLPYGSGCTRVAFGGDRILGAFGTSYGDLNIEAPIPTLTAASAPTLARFHTPNGTAPATNLTYARHGAAALDTSSDGSVIATARAGSAIVDVRRSPVSGAFKAWQLAPTTLCADDGIAAALLDVSDDGSTIAIDTSSTLPGCLADMTLPSEQRRIWGLRWNGSSWGVPFLMSKATDGTPTGGHGPQLSADGRHLAFTDEGTTLWGDGLGDVNGTADVFVRDFAANGGLGVTTLVSVGAGGWQQSVPAAPIDLDPSGRYLLWTTGVPAAAAHPDDERGSAATNLFITDRDTDADFIFDEPDAMAVALVGHPQTTGTDASRVVLGIGLTQISGQPAVLFQPQGGPVHVYDTATGDVSSLGVTLPWVQDGTWDLADDGRRIFVCGPSTPRLVSLGLVTAPIAVQQVDFASFLGPLPYPGYCSRGAIAQDRVVATTGAAILEGPLPGSGSTWSPSGVRQTDTQFRAWVPVDPTNTISRIALTEGRDQRHLTDLLAIEAFADHLRDNLDNTIEALQGSVPLSGLSTADIPLLEDLKTRLLGVEASASIMASAARTENALAECGGRGGQACRVAMAAVSDVVADAITDAAWDLAGAPYVDVVTHVVDVTTGCNLADEARTAVRYAVASVVFEAFRSLGEAADAEVGRDGLGAHYGADFTTCDASLFGSTHVDPQDVADIEGQTEPQWYKDIALVTLRMEAGLAALDTPPTTSVAVVPTQVVAVNGTSGPYVRWVAPSEGEYRVTVRETGSTTVLETALVPAEDGGYEITATVPPGGIVIEVSVETLQGNGPVRFASIQ